MPSLNNMYPIVEKHTMTTIKVNSPSEQERLDGTPGITIIYNRRTEPGKSHGPFGEIKWQLGPIREQGINGTTIEDIMEILILRLKGFQKGVFACRENDLAIEHLEIARNFLLQRTRVRVRQGVEGTNTTHNETE